MSAHLRRTLSALALLLALGAGVDAQVLHDTWYKLKASGRGFAVSVEDGSDTKASAKVTAYMHVTADEDGDGGPPSTPYQFALYTQDEDGAWVHTYDSGFSLFGDDETLFFTDEYFEFHLGGGVFFGGYMAGRFSLKLDGEGALKKARFQSLGAELIDGTTGADDVLVGGYKVKGTQVDPSKLPFPLM